MHRGFRLLQFVFLLIAGMYSQHGWAESCGGSVGQMTINVPNIRYLPTLRADTQMTNAMADSGGGIHFVCDLQLPTAGWKRIVYQQRATTGAPRVINGQHVYASALSGMGYSLGFQCGGVHRYQYVAFVTWGIDFLCTDMYLKTGNTGQ